MFSNCSAAGARAVLVARPKCALFPRSVFWAATDFSRGDARRALDGWPALRAASLFERLPGIESASAARARSRTVPPNRCASRSVRSFSLIAAIARNLAPVAV